MNCEKCQERARSEVHEAAHLDATVGQALRNAVDRMAADLARRGIVLSDHAQDAVVDMLAGHQVVLR